MTKKKENKLLKNKDLGKYNKQSIDTWRDEKHQQKLKKLFEALKGWLNKQSACSFSWITEPLFYARSKDPEFLSQVKDAIDYWIWVVENQKRKLIMKEYRPAIEKELKSRKREIYGDKLGIDDGEGGSIFKWFTVKVLNNKQNE